MIMYEVHVPEIITLPVFQYHCSLCKYWLKHFVRDYILITNLMHWLLFICLACIVVILCVFVASYVYLWHLMCICGILCVWCTLCVFVVICVYFCSYLNAGLLASSQYPEGLATGQLDTGFSWFPCVYERMLRWFPSFQVATTCFSYSPPDLNFLVTFFFIFVYM